MGLDGILRRQLRVFMLAMVIYLDYKTVQKREKWASEEKRDKIWENAHERNAKRVLKAIMELKGLWVKLGQYLSTRADVLPDAFIFHLKQLQDSLPPRPVSEVYQTIEKAFGKDHFAHFDETPLATASIAQVHRAQTMDGMDVVVKVQHKGVKKIILQDLKNAKTLVEWIAWAEPRYNFGPVIDEWCAEVPKELDFDLEAENTRRVAKNLDYQNQQSDNLPLHKVDVLIPKVIQSSEKVLVLEYMDGVRISDLAALDSLGVDRQTLVETITCSYAHQIYVDGFFNGDPHPGNFLVSKVPPFKPILLDFGLTKTLSPTVKKAFAKMLLAAAEGDYASLLSSFSEMGLQLRIDMPEDAMAVTNFFFRRSIPAKESLEQMKEMIKESKERMKIIQEKLKQEDNGKSLQRNPVDAFPGDAVFFARVLNLLRGLSSMLGARVIYLDVMRPFAEAALWSETAAQRSGKIESSTWFYKNEVLSETETKLRELLLELGRKQAILGIQVCVYKEGKVIVDTAAGVLGKFDPRPVQPDTLFPVFSVTKGITAGLVHWLIDQGKLSLEDKVMTLWPEFAEKGKQDCTVSHVLNHTAGLHNALLEILKEDPLLMCNFSEMVNQLASSEPKFSPGSHQAYHSLTFGWLCGAIIERASGRKFQDMLEEVFVHPLKVEGEFYIGIPPGVEARLASLTMDEVYMKQLADMFQLINPSLALGATLEENGGAKAATSIASMPLLFNTLFIRRAVIPAANGHFSARALARYYAMLATSGHVPPFPSSTTQPLLGSHPHIPIFNSKDADKKKKKKKMKMNDEKGSQLDGTTHGTKIQQACSNGVLPPHVQLFTNPKIVDSLQGSNEYSKLCLKRGPFGLGFRRYSSAGIEGNAEEEKEYIAFGHSGMGGSTGFCFPSENVAIAITLNKLSRGEVTAEVVRFLCSELGLPCPDGYAEIRLGGPDARLEIAAQYVPMEDQMVPMEIA